MEVKIGVVSDTHIPRRATMLPRVVLDKFDGVAAIIHAGDLVDMKVIKELEEIAPVEAVAGNVDPVEVRDRLPRKKILTVNGFKIGIIHGDGLTGTTVQRAHKAFADENPDCIIFGHSHIPLKEWKGETLMFNPGSPTDPRRQIHPSFGVITLSDTSLKGDIFYFDGNSLI